jgi:hypothetical protein
MPKSTAPKRRRSPPKISAVEKTAVRIMRKVYEATGGQPQRWESLGNLGAGKADAAGIAYAVERDWAHHFRRPALGKPHRGQPAPGKVAAMGGAKNQVYQRLMIQAAYSQSS